MQAAFGAAAFASACSGASVGFITRLFHRYGNLNTREPVSGACGRIIFVRLSGFGPAEQFSNTENDPALERQDLLALILAHDFSSEAPLEVVDFQHVRISAEMPAAKIEGFQPLFLVPQNVAP